ncbi:MAG: hypothetical protein GF329_07020 [Candidatus Lokiarchaeota archaeon]|nr:hypothetical protein [Candidatus Lokiarchaeota archaeon]
MQDITNKIRELISNINENSDIKERNYKVTTDIAELFDNLPKQIFAKDQVSLVLSEDTYLELGGSEKPSCRVLVPVENSNDINDGRISLIGPDLTEFKSKEMVLPFSQIIFIHSLREMNPDLYRKMKIHLSVFNILKGFMIRAVPRKFWIRISEELIDFGFDLELLGKTLIFHLKKKFLEIEGIEIVFITTAEEKIKDLEKISKNIQELYSETKIRKKLKEIEAAQVSSGSEEDKKRFECDYEWSCSECDYNDICNEIIDIIKKMREYKKQNK